MSEETETKPVEPAAEPVLEAETWADVVEGFPDEQLAIINDLRLNEDQRGRVAGYLEAREAESAKAADDANRARLEGWQEATRSISGFETDVVKAKDVLKTHGSDELMEFLRDTGGLDHPAMYRFLVALHKSLPGEGRPTDTTPLPEKRVSRLFPLSVGG